MWFPLYTSVYYNKQVDKGDRPRHRTTWHDIKKKFDCAFPANPAHNRHEQPCRKGKRWCDSQTELRPASRVLFRLTLRTADVAFSIVPRVTSPVIGRHRRGYGGTFQFRVSAAEEKTL